MFTSMFVMDSGLVLGIRKWKGIFGKNVSKLSMVLQDFKLRQWLYGMPEEVKSSF